MKKTIVLFLLLLMIISSTLNLSADGKAWYLVKKEGDAPNLPKEAVFLLEHDCYAYDTKAYNDGDKVMYLTFDAGYENGNVEKIVNIMQEENVRGTFFILSNLVKKNTDLVKKMIDNGNVIANHTKNHKNMTTLTDDEMRLNLKTLEDEVYSACGYVMPKLFRYPEGQYDERTVLNAERLGYKTFFWSVAYADWDNDRQPTVDKAKKELLSHTHPGMIVLLHPTSDTNAKIIRDLICEWRKMGYRFETLDKI